MKKKVIIAISILVVAVLCVAAWFFGYHNRKSNDNLPALASVAQMNEVDANELLVGYRGNQLIEVWGEPTTTGNNKYIWLIDDTKLTVNTNNKDKVVVCGISTEANGD